MSVVVLYGVVLGLLLAVFLVLIFLCGYVTGMKDERQKIVGIITRLREEVRNVQSS